VSYTLRGRIESRLAAVLVTLVAAAALAGVERAWWPLELAALMATVGVTADVVVYDRLLDYQPGWLALPLGAAELALVIVSAAALGVSAPLGPAIALFAGGWLVAQVLGHAVLPLVRLTYAQDGGELGRAGPTVGAAVLVLFAAAAGAAYASRPPTVNLAAGVHRGPLVIDRRRPSSASPARSSAAASSCRPTE